MGSFAVTTIVACTIISLTSTIQLGITGNLLRIHYNCNAIPKVVKGSGFFEKVLYKQYIEDIFCPEAQRPYSLRGSPKVEYWLMTSLLPTACCLVSSFGLICITIVDSWQAHLRLVIGVTYLFYITNLGVDIAIAREFALEYYKLTDALDARKAGEGTNYPLDLARIGTLLIVFAILKGIVIHVVTVVLIITSIFLLPAHERLLRARKEGPIFGKLTSAMIRRATAYAAYRRMANTVVIRNDLSPAFGAQTVEDRIAQLALRQMNSFDDLPRFRRLQSTRARRARDSARHANPTRQLRFEESPSPSPPPLPPPPPPPRKWPCTCNRKRKPRASSPPPPPTPTSPTSPTSPRSPPSPTSPEIHATTITTVAVVESMEMAVAGPSGLSRATGSRESSEYITTEL